MADPITTFNVELQAHLKDAQNRIAELNSKAAASVADADKELRRQIAMLEVKATKAKAQVDVHTAEMKKWVADTMPSVTDWIAKHEVAKLTARADRAEHYAAAASQVALASVQAAEKAGLDARLARSEANAAKVSKAA